MTRLEKCELLKSLGYTYDAETGKIFGMKGKEITRKCNKGYICLTNQLFKGNLKGHHFAWYMIYDNVDFEMLDHINRIKSDNRIVNLRISNTQKNAFNTNAKGYYFDKSTNRWRSIISIDGKKKHLGRFDTEEEAKEAYLIAKEKYHII
jgi:hypothetical protein